MHKHDVTKLEAKLKELIGSLAKLALLEGVAAESEGAADLREMFTIIHRSGWTTLPEQAFVEGIVDSMLTQAKALQSLKQVLLSGSRSIGVPGK